MNPAGQARAGYGHFESGPRTILRSEPEYFAFGVIGLLPNIDAIGVVPPHRTAGGYVEGIRKFRQIR